MYQISKISNQGLWGDPKYLTIRDFDFPDCGFKNSVFEISYI